MEKDFSSFYWEADEAAISRVYGGIHYRTGTDGGIVQGKQVGKLIVEKFISRKVAVR